jgi:hypothetical protein
MERREKEKGDGNKETVFQIRKKRKTEGRKKGEEKKRK